MAVDLTAARQYSLYLTALAAYTGAGCDSYECVGSCEAPLEVDFLASFRRAI